MKQIPSMFCGVLLVLTLATAGIAGDQAESSEERVSIGKKSKQGAEVIRDSERTAQDAERVKTAESGSDKLDAASGVAVGSADIVSEIDGILGHEESADKAKKTGGTARDVLGGASQTAGGVEDKDAQDIGRGTGKVLDAAGKKETGDKVRTVGDVAGAGQRGQEAMDQHDYGGVGRSAEDIARSTGKNEQADQIRVTTDVYGLGEDLQGDMKDKDVEHAMGTGGRIATKVGAEEAGQTLDKGGRVYGTGQDLSEAMEDRDWAEVADRVGDLADQLGLKLPGRGKLDDLQKLKKKKKGGSDGGSGREPGNSPVYDGTAAEQNKEQTDKQVENQYGVVPSATSTSPQGREAQDIVQDMTAARTMQDRATLATGDVREPRSYAMMLTAGGAIQSQGLLQQKMQENYTLAMIIQEMAMIQYLQAMENLQWAKARLWDMQEAMRDDVRRTREVYRERSGF